MVYQEGSRASITGAKLFTANFQPEGAAQAVLVFHHGLGEHIGRYTAIFSQLCSSGVAVYSYDAFGHGKSEGERAIIRDFSALVDDFSAFAKEAQADAATRAGGAAPPLFIGGHSLGGLVAALAAAAAARRAGPAAGLVLSSPALDVEWSPLLRVQAAVGGLLAALVPRARIVPAVRPEDMSPDPAVVQEYIDDPLNTVGPVAACTGNQTLRAFRRLRSHWGAVSLPVYAFHGGADKCTNMPATREFVASIASADKTFVEVPGGFHELMMSPGWEGVVSGVSQWVLAHAAQPKM